MSFSISGLASGIDTASMIEQLMQLERIPYTKLETKKENLSSNQSIFRNLNTKLNTLKTAAADLTYSSNFKQTSVKSSDESVLKTTNSTSASLGDYTVNVTKLAQNHSIKSIEVSTESGNNNKLTAGNTITINNVELKFSGADDSEILENLKKEINNNKDIGVTASIIQTSSNGKTLVLTSNTSGSEGEINFNTNDLENVKFFEQGKNHIVQDAQDAELTVNGLTITNSSNKIENVIEGVTFTIYKKGESVITSSTDTEGVTEKVKAFVDAFNEVRKMVRDNTSTDGSLQGDSTLRQLDMELSSWVTGKVGKKDESTSSFSLFLSEIGIDMDKDKKGSEMDGQLSFDEDKFKEILENDPNKIIKVFSYSGDEKLDGQGNSVLDKDNNPIFENKGIASIISDGLSIWTSTTSGIISSRIKGYDSEISFVDDSMENMLIRLEKKESNLKRQFTAMEVAMSELQSQGNWLSSQLASLTSSSS